MPILWLNNAFALEETAAISVRDLGLLHAAGVFTTMRAYAGRVFRLPRHLARLRASCQALSIPLPYTDDQLTTAADEVLRQNSLADARLRLTVTRGHASAADPGMLTPTVLLTATELTPYPEEFYRKGMTAAVEDQQKLNPYDVQAGHKTLNYYSRLAALRTANQRGAGEALWFSVHNFLQSGSVSNVFVVRSGKLLTPPTQGEIDTRAATASEARPPFPYPRSNVLPGVTRSLVLDLAREQGIPVEPAALTITDLLESDECFVTNSIMGVMPVCRIERKPLGQDKPGPVTLKLMSAYADAVESEPH